MKYLQLTAVIVGGMLLLYGGVPILRAILNVRRLVDEGGIEPGEMQIIHEWNSWGWAPQFTITAACGAALVVLAVISFAWRRSTTNLQAGEVGSA